MLSKRWIINTVLIALIVGLAYAGFHFEPGSTVEVKPGISELTPDEVHSIDIQSGDLRLRLQRGIDGWDLKAPINWPAHDTNVRRLLSILKIEASALADAVDVDLATLGLLQPKASMRFNDIPLMFGATNNIGERRYVMLDTTIYLLPDVYLVFVTQGLAGLVDRRLLPRRSEIVSLRLPDLEISLDDDNLWHSNRAIEFSQSSLLQLVDNWQALQATRISHFDLGLMPRQLIEIELADGQLVEFLLMSEDPEIVIAHPDIGLQYHFRPEYRDQLIAIDSDENDS
ncbi:DUF4340 domain-containing protein [Gammaproteobacteria bacterium]|nr:DUF4340 domain-containing protein [Gammaproteobacteria bacterium]